MTSFGIGLYHSRLALALDSMTSVLVRKGHRENMLWRWRQRFEWCAHEPKTLGMCRNLQKAEAGYRTDSPLDSRVEKEPTLLALCFIFIFFYDWDRIHFYCLKMSNLWYGICHGSPGKWTHFTNLIFLHFREEMMVLIWLLLRTKGTRITKKRLASYKGLCKYLHL